MNLREILDHHLMDAVWIRLPHSMADLTITKHVLMMIIAAVFLCVFLPLIVRARSGTGLLARHALESIVLFIRDSILLPNLGADGLKYWPYFCSVFFFILACNLLGLVPYGASATGNIAVTAALALTTLCLVPVAGIRQHGFLNYARSLVPHGMPSWLIPLMVPIELIGFFAKMFALSIRLFANMISGHIVILTLICLIFIFGDLNPYVGMFMAAPFAVLMALFVWLLEIFVAFLQAYIFTILTAVFVGGAVHPH